jgi:fructose/tagatose bisphosphate aldolase
MALTRRIVEKAHTEGVAVETNVGQLPTADQYGSRQRSSSESLTNPKDAKHFVQSTGVAILGVSIGNVEVLMNGKATMNFELHDQIHNMVDIPLTLHGGSGIADEDVGKLIEHGLCKVNIGTALNQAFLNGMEKVKKSSTQDVSPKYRIGSGLKDDIMAGGEIDMKESVKYKIKIYGSAQKAYI